MEKENGISAKIVCHSKHKDEELITMEIQLHRFILPEFNTHRVFSRNFQSSRAVPVEKIIEQVKDNPALPVHWGKNQRGMVATEEVENYRDFGQGEYQWCGAACDAAKRAEVMVGQGYHKQIVNRLLEPFMWTKGVVTATRFGFESFFKLRSHKDAQPEIKALSDKMMEALNGSTPKTLSVGEWHLPYVSTSLMEKLSIEDCVKVATSCCAQVSYRTLDESVDKARKIYNMLNLPEDGVYKEDPPHFSPTEHVAIISENTFIETKEQPYSEGIVTFDTSGNFNSVYFSQYRKLLEEGLEKDFAS